MFVPSEYSGSSAFVALDNASCAKFKNLQKKYTNKMWATPLFSAERQAFEHKANAAHANYIACKEAGGDTQLAALTSKVKNKHKQGRNFSAAGVSTSSEGAVAEADAAAAAAEGAEAAGGGNLPVVAFGLVALLVAGGGAMFLFKRGKKKKKKKKGSLSGSSVAAEASIPRELLSERA